MTLYRPYDEAWTKKINTGTMSEDDWKKYYVWRNGYCNRTEDET